MMVYDVEYSTNTVMMSDYITGFRDVERFAKCCSECPSFGKTWACPPFCYDPREIMSKYSHITILAAKIVPTLEGLPINEAQRILTPERHKIQRQLLECEKLTGGYSLSFVGSCLYCADGDCARGRGEHCIHPDLVRPSLESWGFDVGLTVHELLGIELLWGVSGKLPKYLVLVSALMHNNLATKVEKCLHKSLSNQKHSITLHCESEVL